MPAGDVWVLGAGASAEAGAPTVRDFRVAAEAVCGLANPPDSGAMRTVLDFWEKRLDFLDIEQFFGFVDSLDLALATGEPNLDAIRQQTLFLIAKVISHRLRGRPSPTHRLFVERWLEDFVPVITLNWDILLEEALFTQERKIDYAIPRIGHWDPYGSSRRAQLVFKLHGSLNWLRCITHGHVTFLREKDPVATFLLTQQGLSCGTCGATSNLTVLMVPPILAKLGGKELIRAVWIDAYKFLREARRVFVVGYSFPATDLQTRVFIQKGLREARDLELVYVVTRPKFGTARAASEDRHIQSLGASAVADRIRFDYRTFSQFSSGDLRI